MKPYQTPQSDRSNRKLMSVLPGGVHSNFRGGAGPTPVRLASAKGSRVWDLDHNEYLDLSSAFGALILGHGHEEFVEAIKEQAANLLQATNSNLEVEAIEAVQRWFPNAEMVRFGISGTELTMAAVRLARAATGRQKVLRFGGHYHGSSDLFLGGSPAPLPGPPILAPNDAFDTDGRSADILERECVMVPWNDAPRTFAALDQYGRDLACVIMEPICINGGGLPADPGFIRSLRGACTQRGILFVLDEVITGVRIGPGGAQTRYGVVPDLFVAGKAISNGIPTSVLCGRREIMSLLAARRVTHTGTYNGYPLGLRATITTLGALSRDEFRMSSELATLTRMFAQQLQSLADEHEVPLHINVEGSAMIFHVGSRQVEPSRYGSLASVLSSGLLARTFQQFGVLTCPISRCYMHAGVSVTDLEFFVERARTAFAGVGAKLTRLAAMHG
jgi:glutamate-1-semialdehyde 2,1-aminomutase